MRAQGFPDYSRSSEELKVEGVGQDSYIGGGVARRYPRDNNEYWNYHIQKYTAYNFTHVKDILGAISCVAEMMDAA